MKKHGHAIECNKHCGDGVIFNNDRVIKTTIDYSLELLMTVVRLRLSEGGVVERFNGKVVVPLQDWYL